MCNFLVSQGSFSPKIRFLGQKMCSVARSQTDTQIDTKVKTEDTLSGFQDLFQIFLQPIIKERSNISWDSNPLPHTLNHLRFHSIKCFNPSPNPTMICVAIGYGFFVEMTLAEAVTFIEKKTSHLQDHAQVLSKDASKVKGHIRLVLEVN